MLSRREFFVALGLTLGCTSLTRLAANPEHSLLEPFLQLSAQLCGFSVDELNSKLGELYLRSLLEFEPGSIRRLLELGGPDCRLDKMEQSGVFDEPEMRTLANRIIELWYTGVYSTEAGSRVATFADSLVWKALDFAQPPSYCGPAWWR